MSSEGKFYGMGDAFVSEKGQHTVERDLERLSMITEFSPESFDNMRKASDLIANGTYLVFYANHTHHANVGVFDTVIWSLDPRPSDVYIATSRTLSETGQEEGLVRFSQNYDAARGPYGVRQVPFLVEKDIVKMRELVKKGELDPKMIRQLTHETALNRDMVFDTLNENAMFMVFPETTTEGGVWDPEKGERKGMLRVRTPILAQMYNKAQKAGRDLAFVPISINGFGNVFEPRSRRVSKKAKLRIGIQQYLGVDLSNFGIQKPVLATVGEPCDNAFLAEKGIVQINGNRREVINVQDFTDVLMFQVAKKLDPELQGEYKIAA